jgi:hypothetical protein
MRLKTEVVRLSSYLGRPALLVLLVLEPGHAAQDPHKIRRAAGVGLIKGGGVGGGEGQGGKRLRAEGRRRGLP